MENAHLYRVTSALSGFSGESHPFDHSNCLFYSFSISRPPTRHSVEREHKKRISKFTIRLLFETKLFSTFMVVTSKKRRTAKEFFIFVVDFQGEGIFGRQEP